MEPTTLLNLARNKLHVCNQCLYLYTVSLRLGRLHLSGVSLSMGDRRILCLLRIILWLNFDEVWLFYLDKSDVDMCM